MAQSLNDIYTNLVDAKQRIPELRAAIEDAAETAPDLASLTSTSATAVWRLWAFVVAVGIWLHEQLWAQHQTNVEAAIADGLAGTDRWLVATAKKWQYGDALLINAQTLKPYYATDNPTVRLITAAACQTRGGAALLKVAKTSGGDLAPLAEEEFTALQGYLNSVQMAGSNITPLSRPADLLRFTAVVYFDANYTTSDVRSRVETAINAFLRAVPFNGALYAQRLTDAVQAVAGVTDVQVVSLQAAAAVVSGGGSPVFTDMGRVYFPIAGYCRIDSGTPLSGSLTFTPEP